MKKLEVSYQRPFGFGSNLDSFQSEDSYLFLKHCPFLTDIFQGNDAIQNFANYDKSYRDFYKAQNSLLISHIPKSTANEAIYLKILTHEQLYYKGFCKAVFAGNLHQLAYKILTNEGSEFVFGAICISISVLGITIVIFYRTLSLLYFSLFCFTYGLSHVLGLRDLWFLSKTQRHWWDFGNFPLSFSPWHSSCSISRF